MWRPKFMDRFAYWLRGWGEPDHLNLARFTHAISGEIKADGLISFIAHTKISCTLCKQEGPANGSKIEVFGTEKLLWHKIVIQKPGEQGPDMYISAISGKPYCSHCLGIKNVGCK